MRVLDLSALDVLVADSNHYMRKIVSAMLHGFGIERIEEASDGAQALAHLTSHAVDLVIADYALDTLDCVELSELLRDTEDNPNRYVPVIMLSAYTERWRVEAARDAGVTEFLRKPLCAEDLYMRVEEVIERPRDFVRTARYFGPDRRRTGKLSRRTADRQHGTEAKPTEQPADAMPDHFDSVKPAAAE